MIYQFIVEGKVVVLEWVARPNRLGEGYWRRIPRTRAQPTKAQCEARLRFSELSSGAFPFKGTIETEDGRRIPALCEYLKEETEGFRYKREPEPTIREKLLRLLLCESQPEQKR